MDHNNMNVFRAVDYLAATHMRYNNMNVFRIFRLINCYNYE
jgi:hypothetical protein